MRCVASSKFLEFFFFFFFCVTTDVKGHIRHISLIHNTDFNCSIIVPPQKITIIWKKCSCKLCFCLFFFSSTFKIRALGGGESVCNNNYTEASKNNSYTDLTLKGQPDKLINKRSSKPDICTGCNINATSIFVAYHPYWCHHDIPNADGSISCIWKHFLNDPRVKPYLHWSSGPNFSLHTLPKT